MPLDLNEVSGFISHTDNAGYLLDLYNHVGRRLQALGVNVSLYEPVPLAEGTARSPALAEEPGPDLWTAPALPSSLSEEDLSLAQPLPESEMPLRPILTSPSPTGGDPEEVKMPDYSKFPDGLREKLEMAWKERHGVE